MRKNRMLVVLATAAAAVGLSGIVSASAAVSTVQAGPGAVRPAVAAPKSAAPGSCTYTNVIPADKYQGLPPSTPVLAAKPYAATIVTTQGAITFEASTAAAPCTTNSFRFLAEHGYYNQTHCHRLTLQGIYVLQCGDPTGTGSGGPGYQFADENLTGASYPAGTVAMANAGPNTNGSQFFICWKDTALPPLYTPFGKVTSGLSVLQKIAAAGDDQQNGPGDGYPNLYVGILAVPTFTN
ncbi:MAG TPA: peptidylprolyl isomerase [Actinocrinis sp.]|nr:peptidylprolyl isomerase [Actinocrinis sp.]